MDSFLKESTLRSKVLSSLISNIFEYLGGLALAKPTYSREQPVGLRPFFFGYFLFAQKKVAGCATKVQDTAYDLLQQQGS